MTSNDARRGGLLALLALLAAACGEPAVGDKVKPPPAPEGYRLAVTGATVDGTNHVVVTFTVTNDATSVTLADLPALSPTFSLAGLLTDPVSGLATWQSLLLTGVGTIPRLPLGGPGTPPALVLQNQQQPGGVVGTAANLADLGDGRFTITISPPIPALGPTTTLRVGAWLGGVPGTATTSATHDWVLGGGIPAERATVLDANCNVCHARHAHHGGHRTGVKLCLTCHTIQNADPDTQDPAALSQTVTVLPEARTVVAGTTGTSFVATLLSSTALVTWTLSPDTAGTLGTPTAATNFSGGSTSTVTYTPPAADPMQVAPIQATLTASITVQGGATGGYTPPAVVLSFPVAITVVQPPAAGPAVVVNPASQTVVANGPAQPLRSSLVGATGTVSWSLSPATGAGTLSPTSGTSTSYVPPASVSGPTSVTVTATGGGASAASTFTVLQGPTGSATRFTDPNPLDLGRLVHRIHRGKNLPTLYLSSSIAPAPLLPPAGPAPAALPLPFFVGRSGLTPAPGTEFSVWGWRSVELVAGRVVTRVENFQPPTRALAEGISYPRDLRDCDACHRDAPQRGEVVTAISRRTCQSCHPDVWFGTEPISDLVHFAHPGGPQADDTKCAGCHVAGPGVRVPIADAHLPVLLNPRYNPITVEIVGVSNFKAGLYPTFTLRVFDREGPLSALNAPVPLTEQTAPIPSPLSRALTSLRVVVAGPTGDYLSGNSAISYTVPLTLAPDPITGDYVFTPSPPTPPATTPLPLPAGASGTWGVGAEARRSGAIGLYATASDSFRWPYTGESVTEFADNPVVYVDTAFGTWPGGAPVPRRDAAMRSGCRACHLEISFHGGSRHNPAYCVFCHTPDATDWSRRAKGPDGNVNLSTVYSDTKYGTYDNIEERSIHFKVMIHRIHTGEGQGRARIEVGAPHVISSSFLDDIRFPGKLTDCTRCHDGNSWLLEGIPAGASPTIANETPTIMHGATNVHTAADPRWLPMAAACNSCHGTAYAYAHAAQYTDGDVEQCAQCHAKGALGVAAVHGLPMPTAP